MKTLPALFLLLTASLAWTPVVRAQCAPGLKASSLSPRLRYTTDGGQAPAGEKHSIVVALDLRNREALETFLADVGDPSSPRYQQFMTPADFNTFYAPTSSEEAALVAYLQGNGLSITGRHPNRLLVGAVGTVAAIERTFGVDIHRVLLNDITYFAAVNEPCLPAALAGYVVGVVGLDNLAEMHPRNLWPTSVAGPTTGGGFSPKTLAAFYGTATGYTGAGQAVIIAGAYAWNNTDFSPFNKAFSLPGLPGDSKQICTGPSGSAGCLFNGTKSVEISLDAQYAHATAPKAKILNYMAASPSFVDFATMYNKVVTANLGRVVTTSWGACEQSMPGAAQLAADNIFANANAIGQSWFAASGNRGSRDCDGFPSVDFPASSPHVIGVGGTAASCRSGTCTGYGSETAWYGSGGGESQTFARPAFQGGCGVPGGAQRLVPDVALEATPGEYVRNGGAWLIVGGTGGATPQWAGLFAQLNQKKGGTTGLGNPGGRLYTLCGTPALHDVTAGSNIDFIATLGYDPVTGLGSPDARTLVSTYLSSMGANVSCTATSQCAPGWSCAGGVCVPSAGCTANRQCAVGWSCVSGLCVPQKQANGQVCSATFECASEFCVGGVCCNTACNGVNEACNLATSFGICTVAGETDSTRCSPYVWDNSGRCYTSCTSDAQCAGGFFCANGGCY